MFPTCILEGLEHTKIYTGSSESLTDQFFGAVVFTCNVNPLIFIANRYVLWGEIKNLAFEDKKGKFSRNDFSTAKSYKEAASEETAMKATANRTNFGPILGYEIGGWVLFYEE
jgi:hypothetical protein